MEVIGRCLRIDSKNNSITRSSSFLRTVKMTIFAVKIQQDINHVRWDRVGSSIVLSGYSNSKESEDFGNKKSSEDYIAISWRRKRIDIPA
ncbi:hypothetical protein HAX54_040272, partial [Datura stramonium]|nr:hypothetical protein [Datura stramonium]